MREVEHKLFNNHAVQGCLKNYTIDSGSRWKRATKQVFFELIQYNSSPRQIRSGAQVKLEQERVEIITAKKHLTQKWRLNMSSIYEGNADMYGRGLECPGD